jgi:co-chaperonin GroES (HSP10)
MNPKSNWQPFGKNLLFSPQTKDKIIGDTSRFFFYGKVLAVGDKVESIKVGDIIGYTQWALNKIVMADKSEHFFCREDDDFILAVIKNEA